MEITSTQIFLILLIALIPGILAYKLANELAK